MIERALRRHGAELVALASVLVLAAMLAVHASRSGLTYDEGSYLLSVLNLQGGQALGTDVFAPQPPLFYDLVRLSSWVFGPDPSDVRKGIIVVILAGAVGAYLLVGALVGRWAGVAAAAFFVLAPPTPLDLGRVHADLPALALTLLALGLAAQRPSGRRAQVMLALAAGSLLVVAAGVKLTALIGVIPLLMLLSRSPRSNTRFVAAAIGGLLVGVVVLIVYRDAIGALSSSIIDYRRAARETPNLVGGRRVLSIVLNPHAAFTVALVVGVVVSALRLIRGRSAVGAANVAPVLVLAALGAVALATYRPLHLNHLVIGSVVLGVLAAALIGWGAAYLGSTGKTVVAVLTALLVVAAFSQGWRRVTTELEPPAPDAVGLAQRLAQLTPATSLVVSDNPGIAYLARRRTPGDLVDTARLRFDTGFLTDADVIESLDRSCVVAVVAARAFLQRPHLLAAIAKRFTDVESPPAGKLYFGRRAPCPPGADTAAP